jgi:thioredoxin-like negative regulator of GroEL
MTAEYVPQSKRRSPWRYIGYAAGFVVLYLLAARSAPPPVGWGDNFDAAMTEAAATHRPVVVAFHAPYCPPCEAMARKVLGKPPVIRALDGFIPVRVNAPDRPDLSARYGVDVTPMFLVLDGKGAVIAKATGYKDVDQFVSFLNGASQPPSAPVAKTSAP